MSLAKKSSSALEAVVFFHYGDAPLAKLAQEIGTPLSLVFERYSKVTLLADDFIQRGQHRANVLIRPPIRRNFLDSISTEAKTDVFVFAHGSIGGFGTFDGLVSEDDIGRERSNIRAVWGTPCHGSSLNEAWMNRGAIVVAGSKSVNFLPTSWASFSSRWLSADRSFDAACAASSELALASTMSYLVADAAFRSKEWDGHPVSACLIPGSSPHSQRYFSSCWASVSWTSSGKKTVIESSQMIISGQKSLHFS